MFEKARDFENRKRTEKAGEWVPPRNALGR